MKKILALLFALALSPAWGQTSPNISQGQVFTVAQWNTLFASKQDYLGAIPLLTTGGAMMGPLQTAASTTSNSGFTITPGAVPSVPNNGDMWVTTAGLFVRVNGSTVGPLGAGTGGAVTSVYGRTGAVVATSGDYTIGQIGGLGAGIATALGVASGSNGAPALLGNAASFTALTVSSITGSTQCLQVNSSGVVSGIGATCGGSLTINSSTISGGAANNILYNDGTKLQNTPIANFLVAGVGIQITGTTFPTIFLGGANTAHGVMVWEGVSNTLGNTGVGSVGQALFGNGGSADPSFQSGPRVLLATLTCPNNTSQFCDDTTHINGTYNEYDVVMENFNPTVNATQCQMQLVFGGTFQSTGYMSVFFGSQGSGSTSTTVLFCSAGTNVANTGQRGVSGTMTLYAQPQGGGFITQTNGLFSYYDTTPAAHFAVVSGFINGGTAGGVTGIRAFYNTGNIANGTIKIYGKQ